MARLKRENQVIVHRDALTDEVVRQGITVAQASSVAEALDALGEETVLKWFNYGYRLHQMRLARDKAMGKE